MTFDERVIVHLEHLQVFTCDTSCTLDVRLSGKGNSSQYVDLRLAQVFALLLALKVQLVSEVINQDHFDCFLKATPKPFTPYTLHPTPYTLHPTPYTLHPTPYTLHPAPYTLNLDPSIPKSKLSTQNLKSSTLKPRP